MSASAGYQDGPQQPRLGTELAVSAVIVTAMGLALATVASQEIVLGLLAASVVPGVILLLRHPDLAVPIVSFILYSNIAVVAVRFHGLPYAAAAAFPVLLALPITRDVVLRKQAVLLTPTLWVLVAYLVVQFVGALFAVRPEESLAVLAPNAVEGLLLYLLVTNAIRTPKVLRQVVWSLIAAGALIGALVAHQQLTGNFESNYGGMAQVTESTFDTRVPGEARQARNAGPIGEKNRFAQIMAMLIPLALFTGMAARWRRERWAAYAGLVLILIGSAMAFSRGAAVGIAMMFLAMLALGYVHRRHVAYVAVALIVAGLAVPQYGARILSLAEAARAVTSDAGVANADGATRGRVTEMLSSALVFADHPLIGAGPGMNAIHYHEYARLAGGKVVPGERRAHSLYPGLAAEHGVLGVALFTAMLVLTFRDLARARRRFARSHPELAAIATALIMSLIVYLTTSIFLHSAYVRYFWFVMALAGATSYLKPQERDAPAAPLLVRL